MNMTGIPTLTSFRVRRKIFETWKIFLINIMIAVSARQQQLPIDQIIILILDSYHQPWMIVIS
jgi:hypothetical protein